jgi:hypothetical protein
MSSYRIGVQEIGDGGFVTNTVSEIGAMVIKSSQGPSTPVKCQSEKDVLMYFGKPSASYPEVFEAIAYCRKAPAWIVSAIGSGSLYGGVDVKAASVVPFTAGRNFPYTFSGGEADVSHSFFALSPQTDNIAMNVLYTSGSLNSFFTATVFKATSQGNIFVNTYNYSLDVQKDGYGRSLYYQDVFKDNPYVKVQVNSSYTGTPYVLTGNTQYAFAGGNRGAEPVVGDYITGWNNFQNQQTYRVDLLMDVSGKTPNTLLNIVTNNQPWAFAITMVPMGNNVSSAISYRQGLGINSDKIATYTNWMQIQDDYNNSSAWISQLGSVGGKYALMFDAYNALAPAGVDENNHGGLLSDWKVISWEYDYSDFSIGLGSDLQNLDQAQINPIIFSEIDGVVIQGDRTMLTYNSDTSFVGTRRLYNLIEDVIQKQILRKQVFKLNDPNHRLAAKTLTNSFLEPILNAGLLREMVVICDASNNTDLVLNARQFVLDVYVKVTPTSEWCFLHLIRVSQNVSISSMVQGVAPV